MAYTKQTWECGDLITADKMNHIEDGIADAGSSGYYLIDFLTDAETGTSLLIIVPNGNYSEEMRIGEGEVDKLPLLYRIFTQEKWIPLGWLNWQLEGITETHASFSDNNGHTIVIDAGGEQVIKEGENKTAYDKHVWQRGEAITTEKLNYTEEGIYE